MLKKCSKQNDKNWHFLHLNVYPSRLFYLSKFPENPKIETFSRALPNHLNCEKLLELQNLRFLPVFKFRSQSCNASVVKITARSLNKNIFPAFKNALAHYNPVVVVETTGANPTTATFTNTTPALW
jgi:hypothetical protein